MGEPLSRPVDEVLEAGREAIRRHAWREAFDLLSAADASAGLSPEDLESLAQAAWWLGRLRECISARERAYAAYVASANHPRAALVATALAKDCYGRRESLVGTAWLNRACRLLEGVPECVEQGHLVRTRCMVAFEGSHDFDAALALAQETLDIGTRCGDRDLIALGLHDQGRILVAKGQVAEGMALMDEATVAAVAGELGLLTTGVIYCNMISACEELADYRRAGAWTEAAKRWCERQAIAGFPGICRVHRAEILRLRGAWAEAEQEARRACEELHDFYLSYAAEAFYKVGAIRLRMGDLSGAEEAFRQAHELGREPQPELSLLRLAEGKVTAAAASMKRALADDSLPRLARARLLPAQVEIAIAAGDLEAARSATQEMGEIAKAYGSSALEATAVCTRGALQLAEGDASRACGSLRRGWRLWHELDCPYEAARARMHLAAALRAEGDDEAARLELRAARSVFERLGAVPDARRATELVGGEAESGGGGRGEPGRQATRTFMFTDIVKSTKLLEAIGDEDWEDLLRWHDQTLRSLFASNGGEEIDHAGDGFFVAFETAASAVECAVVIQRSLADHRRTHGFSPGVRIGLHAAKATRTGRSYRGRGVHEAARIAALAEAGEVLASQQTVAAGPARFAGSKPRTVRLKGISEPVRVVTIEWR